MFVCVVVCMLCEYFVCACACMLCVCACECARARVYKVRDKSEKRKGRVKEGEQDKTPFALAPPRAWTSLVCLPLSTDTKRPDDTVTGAGSFRKKRYRQIRLDVTQAWCSLNVS